MVMNLQVVNNSKGKAVGIFIPISDWNKLKKRYKGLEEFDLEEPSKIQILEELNEAFNELKLIEQGKLKARPVEALLDEL
jgi:heme oxygenase